MESKKQIRALEEPRCPRCGIAAIEGKDMPSVVDPITVIKVPHKTPKKPKKVKAYQLVVKPGWIHGLSFMIMEFYRNEKSYNNKLALNVGSIANVVVRYLRLLGYTIKRGPYGVAMLRNVFQGKSAIYYKEQKDRDIKKDVENAVKLISALGIQKGYIMMKMGIKK